MKKIFWLLAFLFLASAVTGLALGRYSENLFGREGLKGSGEIVSRTLPAPAAFHTIEASRGVKVLLTAGGGDELLLEADDNVIDYVQIETDGDRIAVGIDPRIKSLSRIHVTVTVPGDRIIGRLSASSGSRIESEGCLRSEALDMRASSGASIRVAARAEGACGMDAASGACIDAEVTAEEATLSSSSGSAIDAELEVAGCTASSSSGSRIELEGKARKASFKSSSGSSIAAGDFETQTCDAHSSSGSSIRVRCTETLTGHASSGSSIRYSGGCRVDVGRSSGGIVCSKE